MKASYYPEPGIAHDISKMFFVKLNPTNIWQEMLASTDTTSDQLENIKLFSSSLPSLKEEVTLFSFIPLDKKVTFLSQLFARLISLNFVNFSLETITDYFSNIAQVRNDLLTYYFGDYDYSTVIDYDHIIRQNKKIPERIKILLWGFNSYPEKYISALLQSIGEYHTQIIASHPTLNFEEFDFGPLIKWIITKHYPTFSKPPLHLHFSLCYTTPYFLYHNFTSDIPYCITTLDTINERRFAPEFPPSLSSILDIINALGDKSRLALLSVIISEGNLSLTDLSLKLDMSLNAIKYHLTILKKAGIVVSKRSYQNSIYSYNPSGINNIKTFLDYLDKGEMLIE